MKATMQVTMQRTLPGLAVAACGALFLGLASPALAQKDPFANVKADALCTVIGANVMVDVGLIQKDAPSSPPVVSLVLYSWEQHFPNRPKWETVGGSADHPFNPPLTFDLLAAGERYDVDIHDQDVCSLGVSPDANAVRAVVQITVDNANLKRSGGSIHTSRCVSFPNPCKQQ